ncbi:hypothetical protein SeLEV6574_g07665 [Synchytrium endobioticum]|uniref:Uncharacterized protein n=1 Tax=Synchytrium endobioticum TaxID=286115 RepID=A0A507CL54_9FUNG|nr:hypothetical protein SeLEV6574_g07665 [Synchytrium endobioticum]
MDTQKYRTASPKNMLTIEHLQVVSTNWEVLSFNGSGFGISVPMSTNVARARFRCNVTKEFSQEIERATHKGVPACTPLQIMWTPYNSSVASPKGNVGAVFSDLILSPRTQGRAFIGYERSRSSQTTMIYANLSQICRFPTSQTTGCSMHLSAHFIPTVERESIDFVDPALKVWNEEMLEAAGLVSRMVNEAAMDTIDQEYRKSSVTDGVAMGAHALASFYFRDSTPIPLVCQTLSKTFQASCFKRLRIISSMGVFPVHQVYSLNDLVMSNIIKHTPFVPNSVRADYGYVIDSLVKLGLRIGDFEVLTSELSMLRWETHLAHLAHLVWLKHCLVGYKKDCIPDLSSIHCFQQQLLYDVKKTNKEITSPS